MDTLASYCILVKLPQSLVNDLKVVLGSASILERKAFLRSFVEEVQVGEDEVTIHYTIPMPPADNEEEKNAVLPTG